MVSQIIFALIIAPSWGPNLLQGETPNFGLIFGKPSEAKRQAQAPVVAANRKLANSERLSRRDTVVQRNQGRMAAVKRGPTPGTGRAEPAKVTLLPTTFVYKPRFVGQVRSSVTDELRRPVPALAVLVRKAEVTGASETLWASIGDESGPRTDVGLPPQERRADANGILDLSPVPVELPVAYAVVLPASNQEYSLDGSEGEGQVVSAMVPKEAMDLVRGWKPTNLPKTTSTSAPLAPSAEPVAASLRSKGIQAKLLSMQQSPRVGQPMKLAADKKSYLVEVTYTLEIQPQAADRIEVRREVADFLMPKDVGIPSLSSQRPKVYLGEELLSPREAGEFWAFRARRDSLGSQDLKFILEYEANGLGFGGEINAGVLSPERYYNVAGNRLTKATVTLESFAEGSIVLAGKRVDDSFPLSPLYWISAGSGGASKISLIQGSHLQALLRTTPMRTDVPGPRNERLRYGMWYKAPNLGLEFRTRCDNPHYKDRQVLPTEEQGGLVEAIRVTAGDGSTNSIAGVLRIGADRNAVLAAFGPPDALSPEASLALFKGKDKARAVFGDSKNLEYWDDSFLYGGVRVKWNAGRVKWFEIARPVALLYNGTRAFVPPQPVAVSYNIEIIRTPDESLAESVSRVLKTAFESAGGVRVGASDPDWRATAATEVAVSRKPAERSVRVKVGKDRKGKDRYEDRTERFTELTVRVDVKLSATDRSGRQRGEHWTLSHSGDDKVSTAAKLLDWIVSNERGMTSGFGTLARDTTRFVTGLSNVTGTVLAVNPEDGTMLINLGRKHGVLPGGAMEFELFLCHRVNPKTGTAESGAATMLIGEGIGKDPTWLEAIDVKEEWCIAQPKKRGTPVPGVPLGNKTSQDYAIIPRLVDPGSGVLRVRIAPRRQDR